MKKRKIIDLPKPTLELLARCAAVLKPPPALTLSEWADRYRVLSAESSAEPGRWHTDKAPYQREIMDAIGDPHIRKVVIMSAAALEDTAKSALRRRSARPTLSSSIRWATTWTTPRLPSS